MRTGDLGMSQEKDGASRGFPSGLPDVKMGNVWEVHAQAVEGKSQLSLCLSS